MATFRLADPWLLIVWAAVPALIGLWILQRRRLRASLRYPDLGLLKPGGSTARARLAWLPGALRLAAVLLAGFAFARPQAGHTEEELLTRGIDIMMALDDSTSMAAEDFRPKNRLEVAKEAVAAFVQGRRSDRLGLVVFAGRGYTACPLTLDYNVLLELLAGVRLAERDEGTAIGIGLAMALNRLRGSDGVSKVVVLITDGRNNRGEIDPSTAASLASALGIRVYAIGVGTRGEAPYPVQDPLLGKRYVYLRADIDEEGLEAIASSTGGRYYRATDKQSLEEIFKEIDSLETSDVKVRHYTRYAELFPWFAWPALGCVLLEVVLGQTWLRRLP